MCRRIALTATADDLTRGRSSIGWGLPGAPSFVASFGSPGISSMKSSTAKRANPTQSLHHRAPFGDAGIVYCLSRAKVEDTAAALAKAGVQALAYHAGLDAGVRARNQDRFINEDGVVIVATVAFGMGIDKPECALRGASGICRKVSRPTIRNRARRGATASRPAHGCVWPVRHRAAAPHDRRVERRGGVQAGVDRQTRRLVGLAETANCRRTRLLGYFGENLNAAGCGNCDNCCRRRCFAMAK